MRKKNPLLKERARTLRKTLTDAESVLWLALKKRQVNGIKFRRQHRIGSYIIDFICLSHRLIIEVDGAHHQNQIEYDTIRTKFLNAAGYKVLRFWNNEVFNQLDGVLETIWKTISNTPTPR